MIAWFARNHVAANLLMITILLLGLVSLKTRIPLEVFPEFTLDRVTVTMSLPGSTPEDAERGLATRIEEAVSDLEGVDEITSRSQEGSTTVYIDIESGYDPREMLADVKSRVDEISTFPIDAESPVISLDVHKRDVISLAIYGDFSERELRSYAERVRSDLLKSPQITQAELDGVRNYEVSIELSQDQLRKYDLTLEQIANRIENSSLDLSGGNIRAQGGDILIRSRGQAYHYDQFADIVIKTGPDGDQLRLRDIARLSDGFEETGIRTRFNGQPASIVSVYRIGKQSAIEVADAVKAYADEMQPQLPQGLSLSYWEDDSVVVKSRIRTLLTNAVQGGILVLLLLTLFLRPSIAFWVFLGIPVSFMGAFLLMPVFGVTLNLISLFGFILVLGIVVDDAIVTGENVYSHLRRSENSLQAAINGTQEVAVPVTFGVLTTIAAFMPIAFIEGVRGELFAQIPVVVIPVLLFSLIESKFVLPAHLKHIKIRKNEESGRLARFQRGFADGFERVVLRYYQPLLRVALAHRYTTLTLFTGVFVLIVTMIASGWTHFVFFPKVQSDTARVSLTMPAGTPFDITDRYVVRIADAARTLQQRYTLPDGRSVVQNIYASTGAWGDAERGYVRLELEPSEKRGGLVSTSKLVNEWREMVGAVPGAETLTYRAEIGRSSDPIDIQLNSDNINDLERMADAVRTRLKSYPTIFDIADNLSDGKQELRLELNEQGVALGLTRSDLIRQVRQHIYGIEVQRIQRGRDDIRVMVRLPRTERSSVDDLRNITINTSQGPVQLADVAQMIADKSPSVIYRTNLHRTVNVTADMDKQATNATVLQRELTEFLDQLTLQYPGSSYSLEGEAREQADSFGSLAIGLVLVMFAIYGLLAIPFGSYLQPLIVMSVIPFGAIGAVVGHWIMGMDLTIMSLLGVMALIGVVVNDSLVLVEFINQTRRKAQNSAEATYEAVLNAGVARFRPVMLTSMTTFIGLMPLLFEKATQAQFLIPMAVSLGFGILFATFITLIMVPVNFMLLEDLKALFKRAKA